MVPDTFLLEPAEGGSRAVRGTGVDLPSLKEYSRFRLAEFEEGRLDLDLPETDVVMSREEVE